MDEHLFRREAGRIIAALTRVFGVHQLALAEDVVQDALCRALEVWRVTGVPDNPAAWLTTTAKHRALDRLRRDRTATLAAPGLAQITRHQELDVAALEAAFTPRAIRDEQLRMMFTCCQPALADEVQIALVLHILCGFGAAEIAAAFLAGRAAIEKRITRGKHALASTRELFALDAGDLERRLSSVHRALYLLFNEGYHGAAATPQPELCAEALRLVTLLCDDPRTSTSTTTALAALMALHAARLPARLDATGELLASADRDRARWDATLLAHGLDLFDRAATGATVSTYHVEAAIAVAHASASSAAATDWTTIVTLYDQLLALAPSPVVALNRAIAIGERDGPASGLAALATLADRDRLATYPFYAAAFGELELRRGNATAARQHFDRALVAARTDVERRFLVRRRAAAAGDPS